MKQEKAVKVLSARLPAALHQAMQKLAAKHKRSMNAEIVWALSEYAKKEGIISGEEA